MGPSPFEGYEVITNLILCVNQSVALYLVGRWENLRRFHFWNQTLFTITKHMTLSVHLTTSWEENVRKVGLGYTAFLFITNEHKISQRY